MRIVAVAFSLLVAGCQAPHHPAAANCAVRPGDFLGWADFPANIGGARWIAPPGKNTIHLDRAGTVTWNGAPLGGLEDTSDVTVLAMYLHQVGQMTPQPFTTLTFEDRVPCARVERVRALMRRQLICARTRQCFQGAPPAWL